MFKQLELAEFINLATDHKNIAVYKEISGDTLTPVNAFLALEEKAVDATLFESSPKEKALGRYSYLCFAPLATIETRGHSIHIQEQQQAITRKEDPFQVLREYQQKFSCKVCHPLSGFAGGMVGFMSYDAIRLIEAIADNHQDSDGIPDLLFRCYRHHITFDHQLGKVVITTRVTIENDAKTAYENAMRAIDEICHQLFSYKNKSHEQSLIENSGDKRIQVDTTDEQYCRMVDNAKKHIVAGDIFQIVLSRKFSLAISADPFAIYRALRFSNPSPYMFYIHSKDYVIAGASPEKLISIKDNIIESCPLAGTRARGKQEDDVLAAELLADPKEVAEHMMLVDLARNDLGRVSLPGSVTVTRLKEIEKYSKVMHISSTVQGSLRPDKDVFDAIQATFPAGTLSGAPKIKAMKLIDGLETSKRGIYGGIVCGIDVNGNLDTCIAIRTTLIKDGIASVRAGAGIVYDSIAQQEADETYHKAKAILEGILLAEEEMA